MLSLKKMKKFTIFILALFSFLIIGSFCTANILNKDTNKKICYINDYNIFKENELGFNPITGYYTTIEMANLKNGLRNEVKNE